MACCSLQGLAEAETKHYLAVGQMSDDFADAPLVWCGGTVDLCWSERGSKGAQTVDGRRQDRDRFLTVEEFCVRIQSMKTVSRERGFGRFRGLAASPGIVSTDAPEVTFEVAAGEAPAAVVHVVDVEDHLGPCGLCGRVDGVGIGDDEVRALGLAMADLVGLGDELAVVRVPLSTEPSMIMPLPKVSWACDGVSGPM